MSANTSGLNTTVVLPGKMRRRWMSSTDFRRSGGLLLGVPLALFSTIAMTLNLAPPAHAATIPKESLKPKKSLPESAPTATNAARLALAQVTPTQVAPSVYVVVQGDTISGIAAARGLSTNSVLSANGLDWSSIIFPGQTIVLPNASTALIVPAVAVTPAPAPAPTATTYTISSGDTISGVAAVAGVSVQAVLDANGLGWSSIIYPGQVLTVPAPISPASAATAVTPLTDEMRQNAATIISVGRAAGVSDYGLVIALAAAAQESGLRNVRYGDRDSLGLFQQRPSAGWGSAEQVMDPVRAGLAFFGGAGNPNQDVTRGLLDIPGWESMTVTEAAQAVQISAHPDYYAKWEASARAWLAELG